MPRHTTTIRLWKDVIRVGRYVHPRRRVALQVDRARMDRWARAFDRMSRNGVAVPVTVDHSAKARDVVGRLIELRRVGDVLYGLHEFDGQEQAMVAKRNGVSLGIDPDFIDGLGRQYGEAIVHSSLTPVPVVPAQGEWDPDPPAESPRRFNHARLSQDRFNRRTTDMEITSEHLSEATALLSQDAPLTADDFVPRVLEHLRTNKPPVTTLSMSPLIDSGAAAAALVEAARAKRDLAVARGAITPAVADRLFARLVQSADGRVNTVTLSRQAEGERILALAIFDDLAENRPVPMGEMSGLQTLARILPESTAVDAQLQQRMIAMANGK
jgi:hypothetical protein